MVTCPGHQRQPKSSCHKEPLVNIVVNVDVYGGIVMKTLQGHLTDDKQSCVDNDVAQVSASSPKDVLNSTVVFALFRGYCTCLAVCVIKTILGNLSFLACLGYFLCCLGFADILHCWHYFVAILHFIRHDGILMFNLLIATYHSGFPPRP